MFNLNFRRGAAIILQHCLNPAETFGNYLRLGAYICGEPAWDAEFNTVDLLILLPMSRLSNRYAKQFLR